MQHPARTELWAILRLAGPLIASQLAGVLVIGIELVEIVEEALGRQKASFLPPSPPSFPAG